MFDMDSVTALGVLGASATARARGFETWRPGKKLKILLVGYNGKRNTGADVRVAAMVDQFYRVLGKDRIEVGVLTLDASNIHVYFSSPTKLIEFNSIYFKDLLDACKDYHMAVLSEGSTLKSKFANALTLFFCEAAGIMKQQGKPCIAYGSEAGRMDPLVEKLASRMCKETYFIARTEPSLEIIRRMGLTGHLGTDTAWTFPPADRAWVDNELRAKTGWDGKKPILGLAVINPFCWPVRPSLTRLARSILTRNWDNHFEKWYYFSASEERNKHYRHYIEGIARAVNRFRAARNVHLVIIGMEALDLGPCNDLRQALDKPAEIFSSRYYDGYQMTGILHALSGLVTSRYHARVLSMTGGVPSIAVSMDERLYNILKECDQLEDYYLTTEDPALEENLYKALVKLWRNRKRVGAKIAGTIPGYLHTMAEMGKFFRNFVEQSFPGIELDDPPGDFLDFLPPLHPGLEKILSNYAG